MNGIRATTRGILHLLAGQIATTLLTVGFTIYFAHTLSKTEFASIAVFAVLFAVAATITSLGLETNCLRNIPSLLSAKQVSKVSALIRTTIVSRAIFALLVSAVFYAFSKNLAVIFLDDARYTLVIQIMSAGVFFNVMNMSLDLICQSLGEFKTIAYVTFGNAVGYCSIASIGYWQLGFEGWVLGFSFSRVLGTVFLLIVVRGYMLGPVQYYLWKKMIRESLPYYLRGFMLFGRNKIDHLVVGVTLSPEVLATYYVARTFQSYILMIAEAAAKPILVKVAKMKNAPVERVGAVLRTLSRYNSILFVPICVTMIVFGYFFLELYGGEKYTNGYPILVLLCLASLVTSVFGGVYIRGLFVMGAPIEILKVDVMGSAVNIVLLFLLIQIFGIFGVAVSVVFSAAATVMMAYFLLKSIGVIFEFDWDGFRTGIIGSGVAAAITVPMQYGIYEIWLLPVYIAIFLIVLIVVIAKRLSEEDVSVLRSAFHGTLGFPVTAIEFIRGRR